MTRLKLKSDGNEPKVFLEEFFCVALHVTSLLTWFRTPNKGHFTLWCLPTVLYHGTLPETPQFPFKACILLTAASWLYTVFCHRIIMISLWMTKPVKIFLLLFPTEDLTSRIVHLGAGGVVRSLTLLLKDLGQLPAPIFWLITIWNTRPRPSNSNSFACKPGANRSHWISLNWSYSCELP